ncbi:hypothetical protein FFLO_05521 [Filobasidium floriforme]|uniref:Uncharacterized protein n=1 Tax=Filobasidium floriforme TaxID=5210 RepID=A0A8K0JGU7_9TREE|nr:hypothetical protein FFLO_05521 [Filobasidium floriforme]
MHILLVCQEAVSGPWECFVLHLVVCQEAIISQAMRVLRAALGCLMKINPVHQLLFDLLFVMRPLMKTWPDGLVSVISPFICQDQCVLYARGKAVGLRGDQVRTMASAEGWGVEWADAPDTRSVVSSEEGAADGGRSVRWQRMDLTRRRRVDEGLVRSTGSSDKAVSSREFGSRGASELGSSRVGNGGRKLRGVRARDGKRTASKMGVGRDIIPLATWQPAHDVSDTGHNLCRAW